MLKVPHFKNQINFISFIINEDELKIHFVLFARTTFRMINYLRSKDFLDFFGLTTKMSTMFVALVLFAIRETTKTSFWETLSAFRHKKAV